MPNGRTGSPAPVILAPPPDARFGVRTVLALVALTLVAVPFGLLLFFVRARWPPLERVDYRARDALHVVALDHPVFAAAMKVLSAVGSAPAYLLLFTGITVWLFRRGRPRLAAFVAVTNLGGAVLNEVVKALVDRARPVVADPIAHAAGLSFPSGHSQSAVVTCSVLLLLFWSGERRAWRRVAVAAAVLMVLGIGLSRVALSVHYVSDVLAGYALGAAWVLVMVAVFRAWRRESGAPAVSRDEETAAV